DARAEADRRERSGENQDREEARVRGRHPEGLAGDGVLTSQREEDEREREPGAEDEETEIRSRQAGGHTRGSAEARALRRQAREYLPGPVRTSAPKVSAR